MQVCYDKGLYLPEIDLWLDARGRKGLCLVSHGHVDHVARHRRVLSTRATSAILNQRAGTTPATTLEYGVPMEGPGYRLTLYPAGHCLGSAQALVEMEDTGERLLYTGDFKLKPNATTEPAPIVPCDVLVTEATFGHPRYVFPPQEEVLDRLCSFVDNTMAGGAVPVVQAYVLGKSQEALELLLQRGYEVCIEPSIYAMVRMYERHGVCFSGDYTCYDGSPLDGKVLVAPTGRRNATVQSIDRKRLAYLSGWAMDPSVRYRFGVDLALPFSDHADFADLVRYVEEAKPKNVYTLHGFPDLAQHLRGLGYDATHLLPHQMGFGM